MGVHNEVGLAELITEQADMDEAVQESPFEEGPDIITCGTVPPNPSELLHTEQFRQVVSDLRDRYQRVIFDSPPLGAVSDALILSHRADAVLLMLKFGQTEEELFARSIEQLEAIGAPLVGTVLNDIDKSKGYGYAYYYRYRYDEPDEVGGRRDDAERMAG